MKGVTQKDSERLLTAVLDAQQPDLAHHILERLEGIEGAMPDTAFLAHVHRRIQMQKRVASV